MEMLHLKGSQSKRNFPCINDFHKLSLLSKISDNGENFQT